MNTPQITSNPHINPAQEQQLAELFARGLQSGIGTDTQGTMCVEQAVSMVLDGKFTDSPSCVSPVDREFLVRLNDSRWSSNKARAEGLWPLALAQLGTAGTDRKQWVQKVALGTVNRVLPIALEAVGLKAEAAACRGAAALKEAADAADAAGNAVEAARAEAARADARAARAAAWAAGAAAARAAAAKAAGATAWAAAAAAAAAAGAAAGVAANAAATANAAAAAAAGADAGAGDKVLLEAVAVALEAYSS